MESTELATVSEKSLEVNHMRTGRLDDSLFSKELAPHYMQLAGKLATSELVPKSYRGKPHDLFLCWAIGYSIGMSPEQSMQCIAIINGRACMWGDEMLALCMAHKDFIDIEEHPIRTKDDTITGYVCTVTRKGKKPKSSEFTLDMAKRAGLLAKGGVWTQYPERMLKLRARGFCLRDAFPDALKGIKSREEVEDYIEAEYSVVNEGSRTQQLKNEVLNRKEKSNEEVVVQDSDKTSIDKNDQNSRLQELAEAGMEIEVLQNEIKRLIAEKAFTDERLTKALAYYEVPSIEELPIDLAQHFIDTLNKL